MLGATTEDGVEEILVIEQTVTELTAAADDGPGEQTMMTTDVDPMMPRSSPDGSTDTDHDDEQHGNYISSLLRGIALAAQTIPHSDSACSCTFQRST